MHLYSSPNKQSVGIRRRAATPYFLVSIALLAALLMSACASGEIDPNAGIDGRIEDRDASPGDADQPPRDALGTEDTVDLDATPLEDGHTPTPPEDVSSDTSPSPDTSQPDPDVQDEPDTQQPDATVNNCPGGCAFGMVCRASQCVTICEAAGVECGEAIVEGMSAQCRSCSGPDEVCDYAAGQCHVPSLCADAGAECGTISWDGSSESCGICPSTSDTCAQNRCANAGYHQVDAGAAHSCARLSTGRVECWGDGSTGGELGNGSNSTSLTPVAVSALNGAEKITAGAHHTCALKQDGTAWCWGLNTVWQLGDRTLTSRNTPVQATTYTDMVDISAGRSHTCMVRSNGEVGCWGLGAQGQLGNGDNDNSRLPVGASGILSAEQVALGDYFSCARLANHTVSCWGAPPGNPAGSSLPKIIKNGERSTLSGVVDLAAGKEHACALLHSGDIWCWGKGNDGQLGHGGPGGSAIAKRVPITWKARQVAAGDAHTCAVSTSNELYCWGANNHGQVGNGSTNNRLSPTKINSISGVLSVGAGVAHTCATKLDGSAWCWGKNEDGQLGDNSTTERWTPVQVQ